MGASFPVEWLCGNLSFVLHGMAFLLGTDCCYMATGFVPLATSVDAVQKKGDFDCLRPVRAVGRPLLDSAWSRPQSESEASVGLRAFLRAFRCRAVVEDYQVVVDQHLTGVVEDGAQGRRSGDSMIFEFPGATAFTSCTCSGQWEMERGRS